MKKELWVVIAVVGAFMGLMIGYSRDQHRNER
jgi:hypothetical protein